MRHILDLSQKEKLKFLESFDLVLTDCDGVLWSIVSPISGSGNAISLLEASGKIIGYISNNSMRSDTEYMEKLKSIGISSPNVENVVYPSKVIIEYFKRNNFNGTIYTIADNQFNNTLKQAGFKILEQRRNDVFNNFEEFAESLVDDETVDAVIIDIDMNLNISKLVNAQQFLRNPNCMFIIGATDKYIPLKKDINIFGPEGFCRMLQEYCGKEPIVLGKPGNNLGKHLVQHFNIKDPKRVLFIGDALIQDINFGNKCGFQTMAVLTGATSKEDLFNYYKTSDHPEFYADGLGDFIVFFNNSIIPKDENSENSDS